jgi:hypothetical protein
MLNDIIHVGITGIVNLGMAYVLPAMVALFIAGVVLRMMIYFTTKCEYLFAIEFEKRMYQHLADPEKKSHGTSFHHVTKHLLEKTYHEHFELKAKYKRRKFDHITSLTDRLFLIQAGAMRIMTDTLSQTRYLQKNGKEPRFLDVSKFVFGSNPIFNRIMGVLPLGVFHETINILPGIFLVGGIFGTFLGTMSALPMLSGIDPTNVELTKSVMDGFLHNMTFSMGKSVLGIVLSVIMTFLNTAFSPEGMFLEMVNKYTTSLEFLWNDTETNEVSADPIEALDVHIPGAPIEPGAGQRVSKSSGESAEVLAIRDRMGIMDQLMEQTQTQKGTLAPQAWSEQMRFLSDEKKRLGGLLEEAQRKSAGQSKKAAA